MAFKGIGDKYSDKIIAGRPYAKKDQINGGNPVKLTYWEWVPTRAE